jgi:hypothetical protein
VQPGGVGVGQAGGGGGVVVRQSAPGKDGDRDEDGGEEPAEPYGLVLSALLAGFMGSALPAVCAHGIPQAALK